MRITITLTTGNDAFQTDEDIAAELRAMADRIERHGIKDVNPVVRDANGNKVGTVEVEDDGQDD